MPCGLMYVSRFLPFSMVALFFFALWLVISSASFLVPPRPLIAAPSSLLVYVWCIDMSTHGYIALFLSLFSLFIAWHLLCDYRYYFVPIEALLITIPTRYIRDYFYSFFSFTCFHVCFTCSVPSFIVPAITSYSFSPPPSAPLVLPSATSSSRPSLFPHLPLCVCAYSHCSRICTLSRRTKPLTPKPPTLATHTTSVHPPRLSRW